MNNTLVTLVFFAHSVAPAFAEDAPLNGTWSGSWIPKDGVRDTVTLEIRQEAPAKVEAKFLSPAPTEFSAASFNAKAGTLVIEAVEPKSGKAYKLNAKMQGTELKGTLNIGDVAGDLHLIKWTFVPRIGSL